MSSIGKTRSTLYKTARILGDIQAISGVKAGKHILRHLAGKQPDKIPQGCYFPRKLVAIMEHPLLHPRISLAFLKSLIL